MAEYNSNEWKLLRKIFAVSSLIQGFSWLVLALTSIGLYYRKPASIKYFENVMISDITPYTDLVSFCLYDTLLNQDSAEKNRTLIPKNFQIILWLYVFLSLCWFLSSVFECFALVKSHPHGIHNLILLGFLTSLVCTLDVIVFSLTLDDYLNINPFDLSLVQPCDDDVECDFAALYDTQLRYRIGRKISYGVLMTLVARGYLLWLVNCVAAGLSLTMSIVKLQQPPFLQYDEVIPRPRIKISKTRLLADSPRATMDSVAIQDTNDYNSIVDVDQSSWHFTAAPDELSEATNPMPKFENPRFRHAGQNFF